MILRTAYCETPMHRKLAIAVLLSVGMLAFKAFS
jgi:hypothetical protein